MMRNHRPEEQLRGGNEPWKRKFEAWKEELSCQEERLLERIASAVNLEGACQKVKANKGAAGVDGMSAALLPKWLETNLTR